MDSDTERGRKNFTELHGKPSVLRSQTQSRLLSSGASNSFLKKGMKPKRSVSWSNVMKSPDSPSDIPSTSIARQSSNTQLDSILRHYGLDNKDANTTDKSVEDRAPQKKTVPVFSEHSRRLAAFGESLTTTLSDVILVYPCLVLRRQCQVSNIGKRYHLTPFTVVGVAVTLQRTQGITCLWKGVGSHLMLSALSFGIESGLSEASEKFPREVDLHSKTKDLIGHLSLKVIASVVLMPFYSAHLVESIQSEATSESPNLFHFLTEGFSRLFGLGGVTTPRMLSFRQLLLPTVTFFLVKYLFSSFVKHSVSWLFRFWQRKQYDKVLSKTPSILEPGSSGRSEPSPLASPVRCPTDSHHQELYSNFMSQLVTDVLFYPYETALVRLHIQGTRTIIDDMDRGTGFLPVSSRYEGFFDCLSTAKAYEGRSGLYRGFGALVMQYSLKFVVLKFLRFALNSSSM